ncbi:MoaD/ThiS family protein [Flagellimonas lutimaris]|uniref:Molybdopterin synthase sulfur carrier subunit n=1 Tax=Flagellimonas lutimaris TaxID=475082 RepID=A0A3A1N653_9FLAO|nr:MoaD/ThiS family protein [Allomuricauda lutimaris]RIV32989.1 MoaD/ThiS family protein [Allomuricauda lutimaris]|tara:strand:- start:620 stop:856 length:237 start_codon:yes stop_codon:yes gene_type:complete
MKVTVKYFGLVAEAADKSEEVMEFNGELTASELKEQCLYGLSIADKDSVQIAVNQNLDDKTTLKDGDEVALLPPFAGG